MSVVAGESTLSSEGWTPRFDSAVPDPGGGPAKLVASFVFSSFILTKGQKGVFVRLPRRGKWPDCKRAENHNWLPQNLHRRGTGRGSRTGHRVVTSPRFKFGTPVSPGRSSDGDSFVSPVPSTPCVLFPPSGVSRRSTTLAGPDLVTFLETRYEDRRCPTSLFRRRVSPDPTQSLGP